MNPAVPLVIEKNRNKIAIFDHCLNSGIRCLLFGRWVDTRGGESKILITRVLIRKTFNYLAIILSFFKKLNLAYPLLLRVDRMEKIHVINATHPWPGDASFFLTHINQNHVLKAIIALSFFTSIL